MFTRIVGYRETGIDDENPTFAPCGDVAGLHAGNFGDGASVAHNGCCLTVTGNKRQPDKFSSDEETFYPANLGALRVGIEVSSRARHKFGDEIGGHLMSGHIITTAESRKS